MIRFLVAWTALSVAVSIAIGRFFAHITDGEVAEVERG